LPNWHNVAAENGIIAPIIDTVGDMERYYYFIDSNRSIVAMMPYMIEIDENYADTAFIAFMYYINNNDTVLIDSSTFGFNSLIFSNSRDSIFYQDITLSNEDYARGNIICHDLIRGTREILQVGVGLTEISISHDGYKLVYSDFSDVYVYSLYWQAMKCIFSRGGSYEIEMSLYSYCGDAKWSESDSCIIFRYFPSIYHEYNEIYQLEYKCIFDSLNGQY
jgi:hypothetical protein